MMKKAILYTGGALNLALAGLHASFWKMLNWSEELTRLSADNRGVIQVANICIILLLLFFAVMSVVIARQKRTDSNGRAILVLIAAFYATRLALGYPFFGVSPEELAIWAVCALLVAGYGTLAFKRVQ